MSDRFEFTLDTVAASVVGKALAVDVRRFPLRIRNSTIDPERFARLAVLVDEDLERRGLSQSGKLHPALRTALGLFASFHVTVSITGRDDAGRDIAVLAMTDGAQAVRVAQPPGEDSLRFTLFADEDLVERLAAALPPAPAARGRILAIEQRPKPVRSAMARRRRELAEAEREETYAFGNIEVVGMVDSGQPAPGRGPSTDAELLREILSGERHGGGYLVGSGRGRRGELRSAPPVGWVDTELGRYLVETARDPDGTTAARYVPAGRAEVAKAVHKVISSVY